MSGFSIDFEVGDTVECTYYEVTGKIVKLLHRERDLPYVVIQPEGTDGKDYQVQTRVHMRFEAGDRFLRMLEKKG